MSISVISTAGAIKTKPLTLFFLLRANNNEIQPPIDEPIKICCPLQILSKILILSFNQSEILKSSKLPDESPCPE